MATRHDFRRYEPLPNAADTARDTLVPPQLISITPKPSIETQFAVSIVSNCRLLREGLAVLLREKLPVWLVGHYPASETQVADLPNPKGHIVLLDSNVGVSDCLDWIRYWRARSAHVVVIEFSDNVDFLIACIEAGSGAYTLADASIEAIIDAITHVQRGSATCSPELAGRLFARLASYATSRRQFQVRNAASLTAREVEVLRYVAKGFSNQEIADELVISVTTVKHHIHNLLEKLEMSDRRDAARYAEEQGWLIASG